MEGALDNNKEFFQLLYYQGILGLHKLLVIYGFVDVDTERGVNQYQVQFKNLFQLIVKPFNYIQ
jgi:hypothetical protein